MKLQAIHVDTCLPCYWLGHHAAHLQAPVHRNMTLEQLKGALEQERITGCFGGVDERTQDTHSQFEAFNAAARDAIAAITQKVPGALLFTDLEEDQEDDGADSVYAFFIFVDED